MLAAYSERVRRWSAAGAGANGGIIAGCIGGFGSIGGFGF